MFDRMVEEHCIARSACIGYWQGSAKTLLNDAAALQPTFMIGVPRIYDRVYSALISQVR
jgi:long-chain acyl-CoA synthetase